MSRADSAYFAVKSTLLDSGSEAQVLKVLADSKLTCSAIELTGNICFNRGVLTYSGTPLAASLSKLAQCMVAEGFPLDGLTAFIDLLMQSPSYRVVNGLHAFMEAAGLLFTPDGYIQAFAVCGQGAMASCETPRNMVDEDMSVTTATGLDVFCYLGIPDAIAPGHEIRECRIDPRSVVNFATTAGVSVLRVCGLHHSWALGVASPEIASISEEITGYRVFVKRQDSDALTRVDDKGDKGFQSQQEALEFALEMQGVLIEIQTNAGDVIRKIQASSTS